MGQFDGKVAYITGIARGMGRNHAVRLAQEGASIIGIDIAGPIADHTTYPPSAPEDLAETIKLVEEAGGKILARQADVRDLKAQQDIVDEGIELFGGLDFVIANAGALTWGAVHELSEEAWDDLININLSGAWRTLKATVPHMIEAGKGGSIVLVSSVAGLKAMPLQASYSASKYGVVGLAQTAAKELGKHRIRVNTIHPYGVTTRMVLEDTSAQAVFDGYLPHFTPILEDAMSSVDDISDSVLFLLSDHASKITAATYTIDAGAIKV
ncbi:mycofactocin-coupled SDR family oxidoreductase [Jongsikchunia kroppenstedtii]|uniref:mycofactocin-coupled SDR family oxidoreductase n=1 Tax=Jongsikchunia kroppenstedtii TaxID=1121721 RepID=UPI00036D663E|nr:mycofactocin-coupled SDR family oxidoreductase [Jongsikchunia kroppenstedtii]